jgi:hypothetical protein
MWNRCGLLGNLGVSWIVTRPALTRSRRRFGWFGGMELDGGGRDRLEKLGRERWLVLMRVRRTYGQRLRDAGRL